ncbi:MAG: PAS domain S-box protein [Bacteroidales bacterium]
METNNRSFRRKLIALAIAISIIILAGAWLIYRYDSNNVRQQKQDVLATITRLKATQINQWHKERLSEASYFSKSPFLLNHTEAFVQGVMPDIPEDIFRSQLSHIVDYHSYFDILITTPKGEILFNYREGTSSVCYSILSDFFQQAVIQQSTKLSGIYYCPFHKDMLYDFIAPMISLQGEVFALLILRIRPSDYLFPMIQTWPVPSHTAETMLIRVDQDSLTYLNQLRLLPDSMAFLKAPLGRQELAGVKAAYHPGEIFEGIDYKGNKVLANAVALDNLPWIMYSKIDYSEAFSDLRSRAIIVFTFALLALLLILLTISWIYRIRRQQFFRQLYLKQKELNQSEQKFKVALYSIGDGVIITDVEGRIDRMNQRAVQLTGWEEHQAIGKPLAEVFKLLDEKTGQAMDTPAIQVLANKTTIKLSHEALLVTKEGSRVPLADSAAPILDEEENLMGMVLVFRDQTQEREAEKKLRESEEKYRSLVEVSADAIFIQQNYQIKYVNPAAIRLFGATHESQLLGRSPLDFFPPEYHPLIKERIRLVLASNQPANRIEYKMNRLDGKLVDVEVGGVPFDFNNQKVIQVVLHDITERKQADKALQELNEKYQYLYETMVQGVLYQDAQGVIISANPAAEKILGFPAEEMVGRHSSDINFKTIHEDGTELPFPEHPPTVALRTGKSVLDHVMGIYSPQKAGYIWVRSNSIPLFKDGESNPSGVYTILEDITRQKNDEMALRESETRYHMLFESNPHPMWVFENTGFRFLDVNQAAMKKYGYTREEFMNMTLTDILIPEEKSRLQRSIEGVNKGFRFPSEWAHRLKDGTRIEVETTSRAINFKGHDARLVLITDITERKQNQKLREDIIMVRQAAQLKQKFLASMSHEIRTPLAGIMGMTSLLLKETALNEQQRDYIENIRSSSDHLMEVVNNILDLSKVEAGKMVTHPRAFPFERLLERAHKLFQSLNNKDIVFQTDTDPDIPEFIYTDEQRIFQIITNLLGNAIKFTRQGKIMVRSLLDKKLDNKQVLIRMEVIDTGKGIKPENQQKLFNFFSQVEDTGLSDEGGTGLGLAISRELATLLDGEIGLHSTPGDGSTFWFTFKAQVVTQVPEQDTEKEIPVVEPKHFLLVEDNPVIRKVITLMLESMGHEVTQTENGQKALKLYKPNTYDMILMDIQMPVMDGITAVQKLKQSYSNLPPVVALSANAFEGDAQRYIDQGMDDYLVKPVKTPDFMKMLSKWFN